MKAELSALLLVLYFTCSLAGTLTLNTLEFPPKTYHYKGEIIDLIEHKVTPVEFWQNNEKERRMDSYYGIERKFIKGSSDGIIVHYVADVNGDTELVCSEKARRYFSSLYQSELPYLEGLELAGEKTLNGYKIQIYQEKSKYFETIVYMNGSIPIKLEKKYVDTEKGVTEDHSVTNYFMYETDFNEEDLDSSQFCNGVKSSKTKENTLIEDLINHTDDDGYLRYYDNNGEQERQIRERILKENLRLIKEHNSKNLSYKLTLNQFADRTPEEMRLFAGDLSDNKDLELGTHPFPHTEIEIEEMIDDVPEEWDWRIQGKVSKVKSQGSCGSCWAFAATAAIESALSIKYGTNFDLSEQSFVDCDWPYDSNGCQGGYAVNAFKFGIEHGVPTEEDYGEYMATNGRCHINETARTYKLKGFLAITPMSVNALKYTVYKYGPVAVSIHSTFQLHLYSRGIYNDVPNPELGTNHAVVVVGYGVRDGVPYWIVKNSYGQKWGEDGYVLIAAMNNAANLLLRPYLPIV